MKLTQAQVNRLESLEGHGRRLTPVSVVRDARKKSSPLHSLFEWNDGKAAQRWRLHWAREIIGSVIVVHESTERTFKCTGYVKDPDAKSGYRHTDALKRSPAASRESLIFTLDVAAGHLRRAYDLSIALGLQHEIDALVEKIVGLKRTIEKAA